MSRRQVGRARWRAPRRVARRAYGRRAADRGRPRARARSRPPARSPARPRPRRGGSPHATSAAESAAMLDDRVAAAPAGRRSRIDRPSIRNGVRKAGSAAVDGCVGASAASSSAARVGSRIALAISADVRWSAWAAPTIVAAVFARSPANWRKNRRRPRSAPPSTGPAGGGGTTSPRPHRSIGVADSAASVGSSLAMGSANGWPSGAVGRADARLWVVST